MYAPLYPPAESYEEPRLAQSEFGVAQGEPGRCAQRSPTSTLSKPSKGVPGVVGVEVSGEAVAAAMATLSLV